MDEKLKFKRVTKAKVIQELFFVILISILLGVMVHSAFVSLIIFSVYILGTAFDFTVDMQVKIKYSIPTYILLQMILCTVLYILFPAEELELLSQGFSRFILPSLLFISCFGAIHRIKVPPYVHEGFYTIKEARKYVFKLMLKIFSFLIGLLIIVLIISLII